MVTISRGDRTVKTYVFSIELKEEVDGRWSTWAPNFPGLTTWGHTKEEALRNMHDAAEAYLDDLIEAGEPLPAAGKIEILESPAVAVTL